LDLGRALTMDRKPDAAIAEYQTLLRVAPGAFEDHLQFIDLLTARGRYREAVAHCRETLEKTPGDPAVRNNLAWILATCPEASIRDGAQAVELARLVVRGPGGHKPLYLDTLAAAYAETRQFSDAVSTAEEAVALAKSAGQPRLADELQSRLNLYRAGHPYRESAQKPPSKKR
jgi:tetratricopeptide (TPR) repeat protein